MKIVQSEKRSLSMLCRLLGYTRQAYYQRTRELEKEVFEGEMLLQEVAHIRKKQNRLGGRKLLSVLGEFMIEHGIEIGRDAFFGLLRAHGMLVRKRRSRKPRTTFSYHRPSYPNLIRDFIPTGPNQLWVSDITYIRSGVGFGYLSLITDAYSRKIVGFYLCGDLSARGCAEALKMALKNNPERENLIHHSDRGLQYHSSVYLKLLGPVLVSMSENSDPLENAIAERVNGILKDELLKRRFETFAEAESAVALAISTYNYLRPHLSVDMLVPAVAHTRNGELKRHWKNYYRPKIQTEVAYAAA